MEWLEIITWITWVSFILLFITAIVQSIFIKKVDGFSKKPQNKVFNILIFLFVFVFFGCLLYMYTDTLKDYIISFSLVMVMIGILAINDYIKDKIGAYVLITTVMSIIAIYGLGYITAKFILVEYPHNFIFAIIGAVYGSTTKGSKYRTPMIWIGISVFIVSLIISVHYSHSFKELNKPTRYAINYVIEQGYTISEDDYIYMSTKSNKRNRPIKISIDSITEDYKFARRIEIIYLNDKIQQMEVDERELKN